MSKKDNSSQGCGGCLISIVIILVIIFGISSCSNHNSSSSTSHSQTQNTKKPIPSEIDIGGEFDDVDSVVYKLDSVSTYNVNYKDNWKVAPATITKVQIANLKKPRILKPKYLDYQLPSKNKEIKGFVLLSLKIPKAYESDLVVGIDGGAITYPAKGNPKFANEINIQGLIVPGQTNDHLMTENRYQVPGKKSYTDETENDKLNIQKMVIVAPIPKNIKIIKPLKIRFNAHNDDNDSHLYQLKVNW
ncbi:hypothetical protein [Lactobacillus sp. ESL0703]|uniref:hypothetical protein n=1 Tax=Lactobacillus sp. ESL0703 TaxID=2983218 RepID=UPI0023F7D147|nr:hypothetical protein [Lactobacillus sp. ESL0703]MDF7668502.1 hypothetical protein [Lactobacillus sp. ESL0703]